MTFVIVGGGPTGAEMAGAIAEIAMHTLKSDFRRIDPRRSRILLIEAGPRILPAFPAALSDYARKALERAGVEIRTSAPVTRCDGDGVALGDERIEAATVIWAAGVAASPAAQWLGAEQDGAGRVKVGADLSVPGHPEIFVVGDTASVSGATGKPVPGIAPAAKQMGRYAARAIAAIVNGTAKPAPFRYRHYGNFATIGRKAAIADFGGFSLKGHLGVDAVVGGAHLFPDRRAQPPDGGADLDLELRDAEARRVADYAGVRDAAQSDCGSPAACRAAAAR